jgi:hypothetical protein
LSGETKETYTVQLSANSQHLFPAVNGHKSALFSLKKPVFIAVEKKSAFTDVEISTRGLK